MAIMVASTRQADDLFMWNLLNRAAANGRIAGRTPRAGGSGSTESPVLQVLRAARKSPEKHTTNSEKRRGFPCTSCTFGRHLEDRTAFHWPTIHDSPIEIA